MGLVSVGNTVFDKNSDTLGAKMGEVRRLRPTLVAASRARWPETPRESERPPTRQNAAQTRTRPQRVSPPSGSVPSAVDAGR